MLRATSTLVLAVALVAGVTACGGSDDESASTESASTRLPPVVATIPRVELPESFPADVPIPADIDLAEADELAGATMTIYDITGWNPGKPVVVGEAYLAELRELGYEITSRSDTTTSILFTVEGPEWFVSAGFYPDAIREAGTSIGLTVGPIPSNA